MTDTLTKLYRNLKHYKIVGDSVGGSSFINLKQLSIKHHNIALNFNSNSNYNRNHNTSNWYNTRGTNQIGVEHCTVICNLKNQHHKVILRINKICKLKLSFGTLCIYHTIGYFYDICGVVCDDA